MEPIFFVNAGELWDWYQHRSAGVAELWVGVYKKASRIPSVSIREAMDLAICFGWAESKWISLDSQRFCIRFTPRKAGSKWSPGVLRRYEELDAEGMIQEQGLAAWHMRR